MGLWEDWGDHYDSMGIGRTRLCRDGIMDESLFQQTRPRVLFVLREFNDWDGGNLRDLFVDGPRSQTFHAVARWAYGMVNNFPGYESLDWSKMKEALKRVAIINVKKLTGGASVDFAQLSAFALRDKKFIIRQFDEINPEYIVACGTFDILMWMLDLPVDPRKPYERPVVWDRSGAKVIPFRHPNRINNEKSYSELREIVSLGK